jgi:hypothetical protein
MAPLTGLETGRGFLVLSRRGELHWKPVLPGERLVAMTSRWRTGQFAFKNSATHQRTGKLWQNELDLSGSGGWARTWRDD